MQSDTSFKAICKRGHTVSYSVADPVRRLEVGGTIWDLQRPVSEVDRFCESCGAAVITLCPGCGAGFPFSGVVTMGPPAGFCRGCGGPLPWASRADRIAQIRNLLDDEPLDESTRLTVLEALDELVGPPPDEADEEAVTEGQVVAAGRLQRLAPAAWEFVVPVLQTLLSAAAKERLGLS